MIFQENTIKRIARIEYLVDMILAELYFRDRYIVVKINWQQERIKGDVLLNDTP